MSIKRELKLSNWAVTGIVITAVVAGLTVGVLLMYFLRQTPASPKTWQGKVGETIRAKNYTVRVVSDKVSGGDAYFKPGDGYQYHIIEVEIKNTGYTVLQLAPVVQTVIHNNNGDRYEMAPVTLIKPFEAGALAPGETRSGELSYSVPVSAAGLVWMFSAGVGQEGVYIDLGR